MRHFIYSLILVVCGIFCTQFAFSDSILVKGEWGDDDVRSAVPAPPNASIENNVLTVTFITALSDLTVTVTDNATGEEVYKGCISSQAGNYPIVLDADNGNYTLTLTHKLGHLSGTFAIK